MNKSKWKIIGCIGVAFAIIVGFITMVLHNEN